MSYLKAVPVYRKSRGLVRTFEISLSYLNSGKTLLVFPENDESKKQDDICMLDTGFIRLARWLYETTHKILTFYPVAVNKNVRGIRVGRRAGDADPLVRADRRCFQRTVFGARTPLPLPSAQPSGASRAGTTNAGVGAASAGCRGDASSR